MLNVFPLNIIHPLVSNFAFQKIADEHHLAFGLQYDPQEKEVQGNKSKIRKIVDDKCSCYFFTSLQLPCRHLLVYINSTGKDIQKYIHPRWLKNLTA